MTAFFFYSYIIKLAYVETCTISAPNNKLINIKNKNIRCINITYYRSVLHLHVLINNVFKHLTQNKDNSTSHYQRYPTRGTLPEVPYKRYPTRDTLQDQGGSQMLLLNRVQTMEFDIFIITQIVYAIVTFKSIISTFSSAHNAHYRTYKFYMFGYKLEYSLSLSQSRYDKGITMTIPHIEAGN